MTLKSMHVPERPALSPVISVFGVGGAGCNAVQNMVTKGLCGVEFVAANTDAQCLRTSGIERTIQLGIQTTRGLGAGANPKVGFDAAEECADQIKECLTDVDMVFVTAGMGGGTGTGAAPVVARIAQEMDILTVGVVTKPFNFEGFRRMNIASDGIERLREDVHTLIVIPNQNLFQLANENTTTIEAFMMADDVLYEGVKSITDLMVRPGRINLDFADVRSIMLEMGTAMMGVGESSGPDRAAEAAKQAMSNQLQEDTRLDDAKGILINIIGGKDQTLFDLQIASETIKNGVNEDAKIIVGSSIDPEYEGTVKVTLLAAGLNNAVEDHLTRTKPVEVESVIPEPEMEEQLQVTDDFDFTEVERDTKFDPADWPTDCGSDDDEVEDVVEPHQSLERASSEGGFRERREWGRQYVAPRQYAYDDSEDHAATTEDRSSVVSDQPQTARDREVPKKSGRLKSVIRRLSGESDRLEGRGVEPQFVRSEEFERFEDNEESNRIPAFVRRQAN